MKSKYNFLSIWVVGVWLALSVSRVQGFDRGAMSYEAQPQGQSSVVKVAKVVNQIVSSVGRGSLPSVDKTQTGNMTGKTNNKSMAGNLCQKAVPNGKVIQSYSNQHSGYDVAPVGEKASVYAAVSGKVTYEKKESGCEGKKECVATAKVCQGSSCQWYSHLKVPSSQLKNNGGYVSAGQQLGSTYDYWGHGEDDHVHLTCVVNGQKVDCGC